MIYTQQRSTEKATAATLTDHFQMNDFRDGFHRRENATVIPLIGRLDLPDFEIPMLLISLAEQMRQMILTQRRVFQQIHVEKAGYPARFTDEVHARPGDLQRTDPSDQLRCSRFAVRVVGCFCLCGSRRRSGISM